MGTNYYLHKQPPCPCCKRDYEALHIGKYSYGWAFMLHVIPEDGINDLSDWVRLWSEPNACIKDEYGSIVTKWEMLEIVTDPKRPQRRLQRSWGDPHCIGNGEKYDLIIGNFS